MKRSTKIITTVVLTLGIASGAAAWGKHRYGDPQKRATHMVNYISDELELDATQEQALSALKDQLLVVRQTMKSELEPAREQARTLINAETFDQAQALELINAKTAAINSVAPETIAAFGNFLDSLNAEQKARVVEFMEHKKRGHRGRD